MLNFKNLEACIWISKLGSFGAAATRLNTTQPAISIRVAQLEAELGVKLFDRTKRAIALTPQGRTLVDYAARLLRLHDDMMLEIGDPSMTSGVFRLGVSETIVHTWLPEFLARMTVNYPTLALEIDVDISHNLTEKLVGQALDLCFMLGPIALPSIRCQSLCDFPVGFVASPSLGLGGGRRDFIKIQKWPILTFARNTLPYDNVVELLDNQGLRDQRIYASASLATIIRMALDGIGVAVIPQAIVSKELKTNSLALLKLPVALPDLHFFAAWTNTLEHRLTQSIVKIAKKVSKEYELKS